MKREILIIMLLVLVLPSISAEILLSQPENVYNLKDNLDIQIILRPNIEINDFLLSQLICNNVTFDIYRNYFNLGSGEERTVDISFLVDNSLGLGEQENCYIRASFGEDVAESRTFDITREISVGLSVAKRIWSPGEAMSISGTATKMNGEGASGIADIIIEPAGVSLSALVSNGIFNATLILPEAHSGEQNLSVRVYEKNSRNEVTNEGSSDRIIEIRQTLKSVKITLDSNSIAPGSEVMYSVELIDQAGSQMEGEVAVTIFRPNGLAYSQEIRNSGEQANLKVEQNFSSGYWKIEAVFGEISETKLFYVEERKDLMFSMINRTLLITNVGNVPFEGPIEILIGSENEIIHVSLDIGESKRYRLSAPEGSYQIVAKEGENEVNFGSVSLTGKAVNIGEVSDGLGDIIGKNLAVWILIVLLIGAVLLMFVYRRGISDALSLVKRKDNGGEGVISNGGKFEAGVILLNAPTKMDEASMKSIERAISAAKSNGAGINFDGEHRIMLFTPLLTKKKENAEITLRTAKEIEEILKDHNRRHFNQIKYGIGVNIGEIIAENKDGRVRFVSVGNAISMAKKISNQAKEEILVSDSFHKKVLGVGKFEKKDNYWRVSGVADREKHQGFIKGFLDKQEKDKRN